MNLELIKNDLLWLYILLYYLLLEESVLVNLKNP